MTQDILIEKAEEFIRQFYNETGLDQTSCERRIQEVKQSITELGSYNHTTEELQYGARAAWRNSNRCIGRLFWNSLHVFDAREAKTESSVEEALINHIEYATNGGKIRSAITIFAPRQNNRDPVRIYNHQLIRYAGYTADNEEIIGDPHSVPFTHYCRSLGWEGKGTKYDILPLVVQLEGKTPYYFELPSSIIKEVQITHPVYPISELELKWYAVPIISEMKLEIGGIEYIAAPFNGWYMETEIGARNFADENRYNELSKVAEKMGLSTEYQSTLWKDRALIELNYAVLTSFKEAGVSMVDHHTASNQFSLFEEKEKVEGREVTGDWTWLIPPLSPASSHIFHNTYNNTWKSPNFFYQPSFFQNNPVQLKEGSCPFLSQY
ncbi:nitric oxide synthase [Jeotgalibacillus sp. S-D1]|uniref:nitric oxide synthase oxygenase n=1 Tax=Jeotgalibacillus sp. S-D1 TaxID=2552189 RepID=UPI00105A5929|nr:nitric oxide synthase oxygenase [Jeotgalibacillus sp. S-D1]TDL30689.1 nitric oxide synthase [Jeotgalibacillus sp. S-D1]